MSMPAAALSPSSTHCADVILAGGGLVGMTLALGLAQHGLQVIVVDTAVLPETLAPRFDGRASAVASASARLLKALGLWQQLGASAQPIWEIRVTDGASPLFLHFDGSPLTHSLSAEDEALGYLFENRQLRHALYQAQANNPQIKLFAPAQFTQVERLAGQVKAQLSGGTRLQAPLIIGCEGRNSPLRTQAGIRLAHWSYGQAALITTVSHALPHGDIAHERFLPDGPFAILPLVDAPLEGAPLEDSVKPQTMVHRSSIVLTLPEHAADAFMALPERAFHHEIAKRFGNFLGELQVIAPRWSYPLRFQHAQRYIDHRLALVGDAAHVIHPIAGQGLNMGFRDVAALIEVLVEAARLGQDLGDPYVLARYQQWRRTDNVILGVATDALNRLFSNELKTVTALRRLGLAAVNRMPLLKTAFMQEARGMGGKLPKLLQGARV
jgi:2-octaprenyl-6-methoxyphenol hydroxylase